MKDINKAAKEKAVGKTKVKAEKVTDVVKTAAIVEKKDPVKEVIAEVEAIDMDEFDYTTTDDVWKNIKGKVKTLREDIHPNEQGWARVQLKNGKYALLNVESGEFAEGFSDIDEYKKDAKFAYATRDDGKRTLVNLQTGSEISYHLISKDDKGDYSKSTKYKIACVHEANESGWAVVDLTGTDGHGFINVKTGETSGKFTFTPQSKITKNGLVLVSNEDLDHVKVYDLHDEIISTNADGKQINYGHAVAINDSGWVTRTEQHGKNVNTNFFNTYTGERVVIPSTLPEVGTVNDDNMIPIKLKKGWTLIAIDKLVGVEPTKLRETIEKEALNAKFRTQEEATSMAAYEQDMENVGKLSELAQDKHFKEMVGYLKSQNLEVLVRSEKATESLTKTLTYLADIQKRERTVSVTPIFPSREDKLNFLNVLYSVDVKKTVENKEPATKPPKSDDKKGKNKGKNKTNTKKSDAQAARQAEIDKITALLAQLDPSAKTTENDNDENV